MICHTCSPIKGTHSQVSAMLTKVQCCQLYEDCNVHLIHVSTPAPPQPLHARALSQRCWPCVSAHTPAAGRQLCRASSNEGASTTAVVCGNAMTFAYQLSSHQAPYNTAYLALCVYGPVRSRVMGEAGCSPGLATPRFTQSQRDTYLVEHAANQSLRNLAKPSVSCWAYETSASPAPWASPPDGLRTLARCARPPRTRWTASATSLWTRPSARRPGRRRRPRVTARARPRACCSSARAACAAACWRRRCCAARCTHAAWATAWSAKRAAPGTPWASGALPRSRQQCALGHEAATLPGRAMGCIALFSCSVPGSSEDRA